MTTVINSRNKYSTKCFHGLKVTNINKEQNRLARINQGNINMASESHKELTDFIKDVHSTLRKSATKHGFEEAWNEHCVNVEKLEKYSKCMEKLATTFWEDSAADNTKLAISRIQWMESYCRKYFFGDPRLCTYYFEREINIGGKLNILTEFKPNDFTKPLQLLDVGSCYNPFQTYDLFEVTALDLFPANSDVFKCDFLKVKIGSQLSMGENSILELKGNSYDIITFCFLLEYIPSSMQRIEACRRAYDLLKYEGLLLIATPDSKHVGANSKIMKCWRYTLALQGFSRVIYEKMPHMHCMAFRKSLSPHIAKRWAGIHKEDYMNCEIVIPQDNNVMDDEENNETKTSISSRNDVEIYSTFAELPQIMIELDDGR